MNLFQTKIFKVFILILVLQIESCAAIYMFTDDHYSNAVLDKQPNPDEKIEATDPRHFRGSTVWSLARNIVLYENSSLEERLKSNNKDINYQVETGTTLLSVATYLNRTESVRILLKYGADPNIDTIKYEHKTNPLVMAAGKYGSYEILELLLKNGAKPNLPIPEKDDCYYYGDPLTMSLTDKGLTDKAKLLVKY